jgi:membrane-bound PQQ-dependent dehydrogenase (glucose/quinate/shikimate family)
MIPRAICVFAASLAVLSVQASTTSRPTAEWPGYGGDAGGTRYSKLTQINRGNVAKLTRAWTYHTKEFESSNPAAIRRNPPPFESTPIVVNGALYFSTPSGRVIALDAETGAQQWIFDPQPNSGLMRRFDAHRGVSYWEGKRGPRTERRIFTGTFDGRLMALDASTGRPATEFAHSGTLNLRAGVADKWPDALYSVTSPPTVYKDLVIVGAAVPEGPSLGPSGDVRAFDAWTGKLAWQFHTIPRPGEPGSETWAGNSAHDRTGVNVWPPMSVDSERGILYLPVGSPAYDFYGGDRKGNNLYANSLVALQADTGKLLWYYQLVHHDLWDYDPPAQPTLVTVRQNGKEIAAVAQVTKTGHVFVFDRVTGKPLFSIEERPVPASDVPGEAASPTQPVPLKPPPLARHSITRQEISRVTRQSMIECSNLFHSTQRGGLYQPAGTRLTLMFPGTIGGATWSGASFDPTSSYLYVNINELGAIGMMQLSADGKYRRTSRWGEYARFWDHNRWPCQQPPWGTLNAVNLTTGEIAWRVPLGVVDSLAAIGVAPTGTPNLGGSIATAGGLVFIAGSSDSRLRAFDSRTGKELWVTRLEASGHATPMTYEGRSGKQFVVIAAGGGGKISQGYSDVLAAYALSNQQSR